MIHLLVALALADDGPLQVVPLESSIEVGGLGFEFKPGKPPGRTWMYITSRSDLLLCSIETKQSYSKIAAFVVAAAAYTGPDADLGQAKTSIVSSDAHGYCNVMATVKEGNLFLTWQNNDSCYGSAGCIREYATLAVSDRAELQPLIDRLNRAAQ